jgi:hypothetical protein
MTTLSQVQLLYQLTPIWLQNGIASNIVGNYLPILSILNYEVFSALAITPTQQMGPEGVNMPDDWSFENAFGIFQAAPGGALVRQSIAEYPFANLSVASNATLRNPIDVSMIMMTPMKEQSAWAMKQSRMSSLKAVLDARNNLGGTYIVFTPAYIYNNMLLENLVDASTSQSPLPQNTWRWDFHQPLVSLADLQIAEGNLISKLTAGLPTSGAITAAETAIGIPASVANSAPGITVPQISASPMATMNSDMSIVTPFSQGGGNFNPQLRALLQTAINNFNNPR